MATPPFQGICPSGSEQGSGSLTCHRLQVSSLETEQLLRRGPRGRSLGLSGTPASWDPCQALTLLYIQLVVCALHP